MALPASGQISMNDIRTEMGQTTQNNYSLELASWGAWEGNGWYYTPVNIHSDNTGDYPSGYPIPLSDWYSYDNSLSYTPSDTFRSMFLNYTGACYSSTMTVFDLGTTNTTFDLIVSGSASDFSGIDYVRFYYGQPWNSAGTNTGDNSQVVWIIYVNQGPMNTTYTYNYVYNSGRGQKLYCIATAGCY